MVKVERDETSGGKRYLFTIMKLSRANDGDVPRLEDC